MHDEIQHSVHVSEKEKFWKSWTLAHPLGFYCYALTNKIAERVAFGCMFARSNGKFWFRLSRVASDL